MRDYGSSSTIWLLQENCGCEVSAEAFEWAVRENGRKTECQRVSDDVLPNVLLHITSFSAFAAGVYRHLSSGCRDGERQVSNWICI